MTADPAPELVALASIEDVESALDADTTTILFKHSPICGTSSRALRQVKAFARDNPQVRVHIVDVVNDRTISRYVAERLGIRHQSPQAIVIRDGRPSWNGSHFRVSARALQREVDRP